MQQAKHIRLKRFNGNALVEYVLPCALVLTIGLVSLPGLTNNFGTALSGVFIKPLPSNTASSGGILGINSPSPGGGIVGGGTTTEGFTGEEGLRPETAGTNGAKVDGQIETAGVNGNAEAVTSAARELETLLKNTPNLQIEDPVLYDIITRMANKGHALAQLMNNNACSADFATINNQLDSIYNEYKNYLDANPAMMAAKTTNGVIDSNYGTISSHGRRSESDAALQSAGVPVSEDKSSSTQVTDSSNNICDQGGSNCKK